MTAAPAPLIVAVAPTGVRRTKQDHPALPITADEIGATAAACREAGAAMIHLHVRDRDGRHILDAEIYRDATAAVRREAGDDIIVQVTSESAGRYGPDAQMAMVRELRPEAVSFAVSEIIPGPGHEVAAAAFLAWLVGESILPQFVLYSPAEVERYRDLRSRGIIPGELQFVLFVLGRYGVGAPSEPCEILPFLAVHGNEPSWAVCAFGHRECACALTAAALGGHIRVGFENNLQLSDQSLAPDNAALVTQARAGAALMGRELADASTARHMLMERTP
jgi:uncharacterized protein (DUF849 family)